MNAWEPFLQIRQRQADLKTVGRERKGRSTLHFRAAITPLRLAIDKNVRKKALNEDVPKKNLCKTRGARSSKKSVGLIIDPPRIPGEGLPPADRGVWSLVGPA